MDHRRTGNYYIVEDPIIVKIGGMIQLIPPVFLSTYL